MFLYVTDYDMKLAKGETPRETTGPLPVFDDEGDGMDENAMRPETPATPQPHGGSDPQRPSAQGTPQHQELSTPTKAPVAANLPDYKQCPCPACTPWVNQLEKEKIQAMKQSSGGGAVKGDETEDEETGATSGKRKRTKKVKEEDEDMGDSQSKVGTNVVVRCLRLRTDWFSFSFPSSWRDGSSFRCSNEWGSCLRTRSDRIVSALASSCSSLTPFWTI